MPWLQQYVLTLFQTNTMGQPHHLEGEADELPARFAGLDPGSSTRLVLNHTTVDVWAIPLTHTVPAIGFGFSVVREKLRAELHGCAGPEIRARRLAGEAVTEPVSTPVHAFVCDTDASVLAQQPDLFRYPTVIMECTFLYADERANAARTLHGWVLLVGRTGR